MNWHDYLRDRLLTLHPDSVCALDAPACQLVAATLPTTPCHPPEVSSAMPCSLAVGIDALDGRDAADAAQWIARVRLYAAPRLLLAASRACTLDDDAFRALGFSLSLTDPAARVRVYEYDLATYKTVPDWLNARFWAHPERWEP